MTRQNVAEPLWSFSDEQKNVFKDTCRNTLLSVNFFNLKKKNNI